MCKSVEEYAERKAKEAAEKAAIEEKKVTVNNLYDMGMDTASIAKAVSVDEETIKQWLAI